MNQTGKKILIGLGVAIFWIGAWELLCLTVASELLLPSPLRVVTVWFDLAKTSTFWVATGYSLLRISVGFLLAVLCGCLLAAFTARVKLAKALITPILKVIRAAPVASFIILALVWIKTDSLPLWISFLMVLPIVWANVEEGILQVDGKLLEVAKVYHLPAKKVWREIRFPSLVPYLLASMKTGLGFAWKSGIAAEIICRPTTSIGNYLQKAKLSLETPSVFAWTLTVILLSVLLEKLLTKLVSQKGKRFEQSKKEGRAV